MNIESSKVILKLRSLLADALYENVLLQCQIEQMEQEKASSE